MSDTEHAAAPAETTPPAARSQRAAQLALLSLGHAVNDGYANVIAPLWPVVKAQYGLTNAAIGNITFLWGLTTNFGQPIFGYLADRHQPRRLMVCATLLSTVVFSFIGWTHSLPSFLIALLIGGIGVALYHPRAGALSVAHSGGRRALGMGLFSAGGTVGFAAGYMGSPYLHDLVGSMKGLAYACPIGLITVLLMWVMDPEGKKTANAQTLNLRRDVFPQMSKLLPLLGTMALRSSAIVAFSNFLPLLLASQGRALVAGGHAGFIFMAGGALGGIVGGHVSDRLGRRGITIVSMALTAPVMWWALRVSGAASLAPFFGTLFLTGFVLRSGEGVNIAHMQELMPRGASLASSLGMGGAWGIAGLVCPPLGRLADQAGVEYALSWVVWIPLAAAIVALFIPRGATHRLSAVGADLDSDE
jgi:FSR family fosmidomycin resistance protein-like MFS transporter